MAPKSSYSVVAISLLVLSSLLLPSSAFAEEEDPRVSNLLDALELPSQAQQLREAGTPDADVNRAIEVIRERTKPDEDVEDAERRPAPRAAQAAEILRAEQVTARKYGSMENFGDFVEQQVDEGKRGRQLAKSIQQQRDNRRPDTADRGPAQDKERGERPSRPDESAPGERRPSQGENARHRGQRPASDDETEPGDRRPDRGEQPQPAGADEADEKSGADSRSRQNKGQRQKAEPDSEQDQREAPGRSNRP